MQTESELLKSQDLEADSDDCGLLFKSQDLEIRVAR